MIYGVRPARTFEQAAAKFVLENQHKRSLPDDIGRLKGLMPHIGGLPLDRIHGGSLQPWIAQRRRDGVATGTINQGLQIVRRVLNLAAGEWVDDVGHDVASRRAQGQTVAKSRQAKALSVELGRANDAFAGSAAPLGGDGLVCCQHRLPGW